MKFLTLAVLSIGLSIAASAAEMPKSVLHIITLHFKPGTTDADKAKVVDATKKMATDFPGITRLWFKKIKVQVPQMTDIIVMEFKDDKAFAAYTDTRPTRLGKRCTCPCGAKATRRTSPTSPG